MRNSSRSIWRRRISNTSFSIHLHLGGGLDIIAENHIDLVLLDLSLIDSVGFNTVRKFVDEAPDIPVVVLTGMKNEIIGIQSVRAGAQDFLIKGEFDSHRLVKTIKFSLQRSQTRRQLQKRAEELSIEQDRFKTAQRMANFANWEMDVVNNSMKWTEEMFRIFGLKPNSIKPTLSSYLDFVHLNEREKVEAFFHGVMKSGESKQIKHQIVVEGKTLKQVLVKAKITYDELTNKIMLIGSAQDVTNLDKQLSLEDSPKREIKEDTSGFQKPSAKPDLHIHLFSLIAELSKLEALNYPDTKDIEQRMTKSLLRLTEESCRQFASYFLTLENPSPNATAFNLYQLGFAVKKIFDLKYENTSYQLNFSQHPDVPRRIISDPSLIFLTLFNGLDSILKQSAPEHPIIELGLESQSAGDYKALLNFNCTFKPDTSPDLNSFFDETTEKMVSVLGGTFLKHKLKNQKAEFALEIPVLVKSLESKNKETGIPEKINILLIEDHVLNRLAIKRLFSRFSQQTKVESVSKGSEALEVSQQNRYHIVLVNLHNRKINGIDTATQIKRQLKVPVIAFSAKYSQKEMEECLTAGIDAYFEKPLKEENLFPKILALVESRSY